MDYMDASLLKKFPYTETPSGVCCGGSEGTDGERMSTTTLRRTMNFEDCYSLHLTEYLPLNANKMVT